MRAWRLHMQAVRGLQNWQLGTGLTRVARELLNYRAEVLEAAHLA
jgi:hypothetical protein